MTNPIEPSFVDWISRYESVPRAIGDLARDIAADSQFPCQANLAEMRFYLEGVEACEGALQTLVDAWSRYRSHRKRLRVMQLAATSTDPAALNLVVDTKTKLTPFDRAMFAHPAWREVEGALATAAAAEGLGLPDELVAAYTREAEDRYVELRLNVNYDRWRVRTAARDACPCYAPTAKRQRGGRARAGGAAQDTSAPSEPVTDRDGQP